MADTTYLDWPFFDAWHRALAADLDAWAARAAVPLADREDDADTTCRALVAALADGGWLRHVVPAAYGGLHETFDVRALCLIRETLARYGGLADVAFAMQGLGSGAITLFGSEALKRDYLPAVAKGAKIAAFALSEPEAGSDVAALGTVAADDGEAYVLNGVKTWITNGGIADYYTIFARTGEEPGAKGLSAFIVDADTPGLEITERIKVIAPHPLATLELRGCRVPKSHLLGAPGQGFKIAIATLDIFRARSSCRIGSRPRPGHLFGSHLCHRIAVADWGAQSSLNRTENGILSGWTARWAFGLSCSFEAPSQSQRRGQ